MIDMGLTAGAKSLWEDHLLCDYTIKVEEREFRVHKIVMAFVSEYFRVMFTGSMKESQTDRVELKELSAETFSKLLTLIYTGDEDIITENAVELFPCAVYLEVRSAIKECKQKILNSINESNCLDILTLLLTYGEPNDAEAAKDIITENWKTFFGKCESKNLTYNVLQVIIDIWRESEWKLFQFIKDWIDVDNKNRVKCTNDLMNRVRFSLMTPQEVAAVKKTPLYKRSRDAWRELVDRAATYLKLPIHSKVLEDTEQTTMRKDAEPVFFTENNYKGSKTCNVLKRVSDCVVTPFSHLNGRTYRLNDKTRLWETKAMARLWEVYNVKGPKFSGRLGGTIHVNNFLICYTELDKGQTDWYIFDARTLQWAEMASMSRPKADFALVHHDKHLYVLGGRTGNRALTKSVEQYDFKTNTWKSTGKPMPVPAADLTACLLGDAVYCCSGYIQNEGLSIRSKRMDRLDISTHTWESRAPMLAPEYNHSEMCVMKISGEEVVMLVRKYRVDIYNPITDQWSVCNAFTERFTMYRWDERSRFMTQGDAIYLLNVLRINEDADSDSSSDGDFFNMFNIERICCKLTMQEKWDLPYCLLMNGMPVLQHRPGEDEDLFGGALALPHHKLKNKLENMT